MTFLDKIWEIGLLDTSWCMYDTCVGDGRMGDGMVDVKI
jgi:hypothetical protein